MTLPDLDVQWRFLDNFFIRFAGFPFSLLKQFRFEKTWNLLEEWWIIHSEIQEASKSIEEELNGLFFSPDGPTLKGKFPATFHNLRRRRCISQEPWMNPFSSLLTLIEKWNQLLLRDSQTVARARVTFETELIEMRQKLRTLLETNSNFKEAMFLSSNGSSEIAVESYLRSKNNLRNKETRKRERLFMNYLQRVCTKNETTSFFGPANRGRATPKNPNNIELECVEGLDGKPIVRNETFMSFWAIQELANAMSKDPFIFPFISPKLTPLYHFSDHTLYYLGLEKIRLENPQSKVLSSLNGIRSFREMLNYVTDLGGSEDIFWQACNSLAERRIITNSLLVNPFSDEGVQTLLIFLDSLHSENPAVQHWKKALLKLEQLRVKFRDTRYPDRTAVLLEANSLFEDLVGKQAKRGQGKFYGDRSIFVEECQGVLKKFEIGGLLFKKIRDSLKETLAILGLLASASWEYWQLVGAETLRIVSEGKMQVPFIDYWNEFDEVCSEVQELDSFKNYRSALTSAAHAFNHIAEDPDELDVENLLSTIQEMLKAAGLLKRAKYPLFATVDVLVSSPSLDDLKQGKFSLTLGEIQSYFFPISYNGLYHFTPQKTEIKEQISAVIDKFSNPSQFIHVPLPREYKVYPLMPQNAHFLHVYSATAQQPTNDEVSLYSLDVVERKGELLLKRRDDDTTFKVYTLLSPQDNLFGVLPKIFSFPLLFNLPLSKSTQKHLPRVTIGDIIYQRESWWFQSEDIDCIRTLSDFELFSQAFSFAKSHQMSLCVFARHRNEIKPFFVDFKNFFLIEVLQHIIHVAPETNSAMTDRVDQFDREVLRLTESVSEDPHELSFTEFSPGEDELWLDIDGKRHCCELRMGIYAADSD